MPSPNEIASSVLALLAERGLAPTPANYAHAYAEVSGEPESAISEESNELLQIVQSLVDLVVSRTGSLSDSLVEKNQDMKQTVDALHAAKEKDLIIRLAQALTAKADSIHLSVNETQRDLASTRDTLQRMSTELSETRQSLLEDALTGAQNRRGMDAILNREVALAKRNKGSLVVAMIDIDHFKQVNDTHGHDAGDRLLTHVSMIAKSVLRETDFLVRYGGEEFLLILPDSDLKGAEFVMDRLRIVIARSPLIYNQKKIDVTFSGGLALLKEDENGHHLVLRADSALYQAKKAGRNRISIAN